MVHYLFDVDGTLTPSREKINSEFAKWFLKFTNDNTVSLVSGSDYDKTVEQLGSEIVESVQFIFSCSGNVVRQDNEIIHEHRWSTPEPVIEYLKKQLFTSPYDERCGKHFEHRTGMLNFSIVGRNARGRERTNYYKWDLINCERSRIAKTINETWPDLHAVVGGETGVDISCKGCDKSQVLDWIDDTEVMFFGDRTDPIGNDHTLAQATVIQRNGTFHTVDSWKHTWDILKSL
jgi:phosphomannomutase